MDYSMLSAKIDNLSEKMGPMATDIAEIKGMLKVVPLHPSPCDHEHSEYEGGINDLRVRVNGLSTLNAVLTFIGSAIAAAIGLSKP